MADVTLNPWKLATIGLLVVGGTALLTTFVVGQRNTKESSQVPKARSVEHHRTVQGEIEKCNRYAAEQVGEKTATLLKDAAIGAGVGAGTGAAGGAVAEGGSGAGKGAAIGGIVGAVGGVLYGINENMGHDERYQKAYASCMRSHGYE
jgi:hypothetical protein